VGILRTFIASELPTSLQDSIDKATGHLHGVLGNDLVRWVPSKNIHLTLKFLGEVSSANLDLIKNMLTTEAAQHQAFDVSIEGIGSYPTTRQPRIIWIGLDAPAALGSLQRAIETGAARLGYPPEERKFSPHLTIGRVRQNTSTTDIQRIRTALDDAKVGDIGSSRVDAIHLFKSDLTPTGSVYTKLFSAFLGKPKP